MSTSDLHFLAKQYGGVIPREKAGEAVRALYKPKRRKYRNEPVTVGGERFDSKGEQRRWEELRLMELAGEISDLKRQVRIPLIGQNDMPVMFDSDRQAVFVADYTFIRKGEKHTTIADFKGSETAESKLKRAIVRSMFGRPVEIMRRKS